jgi:hypothetical protein
MLLQHFKPPSLSTTIQPVSHPSTTLAREPTRRCCSGTESCRVPVNHEQEREFIDKLGLDIVQAAFHEYATWGNCNQPPAPSVGKLQAEKTVHPPDIQVYLQIADEVSDCTKIFPALQDWARNAHSAGVRTLLTAIPSKALLDDGSGTGRSAADIWALLPKHLVSNPSDVATAIHKGDQVWSYTALVQDDFSPKWAIDFDPINYRILAPCMIKKVIEDVFDGLPSLPGSLAFLGTRVWSLRRGRAYERAVAISSPPPLRRGL